MRWPGPALRRALTLILAVSLVSACSVLRSPEPTAALKPPEYPKASLPTSSFPPLPDRPNGVTAEVNGLAARDTMVVAVGSYEGNVTRPLFRWSADAGATWQEGKLGWLADFGSAVGDSSLGLIAFSGSTWVALGKSGGRVIAWTSNDAATWRRYITTGLSDANIYSMTATQEGLVLVGSALGPDGVHQVPHAWLSSDGVTWQPVQVSTTPGQLNDVAAHGNTVVAVGELPLDTPTDTGLVQTPVSLVSRDAGRTWQPATPPEPANSDRFSSSLTHVVSTSTGFIAAGIYSRGGSYRTFSVSSPDGAKWTLLPSMDGSTPRTWIRDLIVVADQPMAITGLRNASGSKDEVHIYRFDGAKKWGATDLPSQLNGATARAALGVGSTALVALTWNSTARTAALFRSTDAGQRWTRQYGTAPAATPLVQPAGLLAAGDTELAFGGAQGAQVLWKRAGTQFGDPKIVIDSGRPTIAGMAASPTSLLMWGQRNREAWAAVSADGGTTWKYSAAQTFGKVTTYSWSLIEQAAWVKDRWVVVGRRSLNGDARISALAFFSTDGLQWTPGVATTSQIMPNDGYGATPVLSDLSGVGSQQRSMTDVAMGGSGVISVGWTTTIRGARPAWWSSDAGGQRWRLGALPFKGVNQAWAGHVTVVGKRVLVAGFAQAKPGSKDWRPCLWTSPDAGKSWTFTADPGWGPSSFLAMNTYQQEVLVTVQSEDRQRLTVWRSADGGATWKRTDVPPEPQGTRVETEVVSTVVVHNTLRILTRIRTEDDAVSVVREISLR